MRLAVYTDYEYRTDGIHRYGPRAFVTFIEDLSDHFERLVLVGRMDPRPGSSHYQLRDETELVGLPHYESLAHPWAVMRSIIASMTRFWRLLDDIDVVWVLGPYPHAVMLAGVALMRRRKLVLGVRQDTRAYIRSRRPGQRWMHIAADALELIWRQLARRHPIAVVGPELERRYPKARAALAMNVSLIHVDDVVSSEDAEGRSYEGEITVLTVSRLDTEKNPLLLVDILVELDRASPDRWRIIVVGEGPMRDELELRAREAGVAHRLQLAGYVPIDNGLLDLYRKCDLFLHVSWTEGVPQVLFEAFASGLPVVATSVGGVEAAADGAALLIPPGDVHAGAEALQRLAAESDTRKRLRENGIRRARSCTMEAEAARLASFIESA